MASTHLGPERVPSPGKAPGAVGRCPRVPVTARTRGELLTRGRGVLRGTAPTCVLLGVWWGPGTLIICHHLVGVRSSQKRSSLVLDLA